MCFDNSDSCLIKASIAYYQGYASWTSIGAGVSELLAKGHNPSWKYRGLKGTLWKGGHRVPFVVRWPGKIQAGTECDQTICTTDLLATCADLVQPKLPDNVGEDSVSFLPALKGEPTTGVPQENDPFPKGESWAQIGMLDEYLNP